MLDTTKLGLAASGGVHTLEDAIKATMAGADCIQMVSALLRNVLPHLGKLKQEMSDWMEEMDYESLAQLKGSMSYQNAPTPRPSSAPTPAHPAKLRGVIEKSKFYPLAS